MYTIVGYITATKKCGGYYFALRYRKYTITAIVVKVAKWQVSCRE